MLNLHEVMLSGIGNDATLSSVGIKTIVDSPDVGQNLQVGVQGFPF